MNIIRPTTITSIASSTVPETDHAAWSAATTYAIGDRCIVVATHKIYESLQAGNINQYPPDTLGGTPYWLEIGATNKYKIIDGMVSTTTTAEASFTVGIEPGRINSIALLEVSASKITITMDDPTDGLVYSREFGMSDNAWTVDWYTWFFEPIVRKTDLVLLDLPSYSAATLSVTVENSLNAAECGMLVVGISGTIGMIQWGVRISIMDFSRKERDVFGNTILTVKDYVKTMNADIVLPTNLVDETRRILTQYRATPILWMGSADFTSTIIFGFFRNFALIYSGPDTSHCNLEIEGLI